MEGIRTGTPPVEDAETVDDIIGGRIRIIQKKIGYRFSLDAVLLAHFAGRAKGCRILDLGTGSGIVALLLAHSRPDSRIVGLELQEDLVHMARRTVLLNNMSDAIEIVAGDVRSIKTILPAGQFDLVVANPPYRRINSGRINPDSQKARARHELTGTLDDFLGAAAYALKQGGKACLIYPARRMVKLIAGMHDHGLEPKRCRMVHSQAESRAEFVLVEGAAGGREEMAVEPPLHIYEQEGGYTQSLQTVFSGLASSP